MSDDCCGSQMPNHPLMPIQEALDFILTRTERLQTLEEVDLSDALGRVLASSVSSQINQPPWNNSAMDGYAFNSQQINDTDSYAVSQRIPAGTTGNELTPHTIARIFTGAPIPKGADTVVMQENTELIGDNIRITHLPSAGSNIRLAGEDTAIGKTILAAGIRLEPQHVGLAASVGIARLSVFRKLKVAIFSSGDELVMPGTPLGAGQIYNSNQFTLASLLESLNCEVINLGRVKDTLDATCIALQQGAQDADLIVASGGVSVGEEDHVKPAVEKLGSLDLWKIAIRPGKPLAFGQVNETPFIGAPGNPVSLFVTFCLFARPMILKMQGISGDLQPKSIQAKANFDWTRPDKRREFARGRLSINTQGEAIIDNFPSRSSGVLTSLAWANGLIEIPESTTFKQGDMINFIPFNELLT